MIALWLAYALLVGALLALAATLGERLLLLWRFPVRWVWAATMLATLVAPPLLTLARQPAPAAVVTGGPVAAAALAPLADARPTLADRVRAGASRAAEWAGTALAPLDRPLLLLWGGASLLLLASLGRSALLLRRRRRAWEERLVDGEAVLVAPDTGPAVVGSAPPRVVLPAWALELDEPLRRLVLRHETEHLRAGDPQLLFCGVAAAVLAPWNPAVWWQLGRLRLAVELDCDRRVLRAHRDVERYGLLLMAVGQRTSGLLRLATPALSEPTTSLERRIAAMTARTPRRRLLRAATFLAGAALLVAAACVAPGPNAVLGPQNEPAPPVAAAAPVADTAAVVADSNAGYFEFRIEKPAAPLPGQGAPLYPTSLQVQGIGGRVVAQFVVGPDGTADMGSFRVLESSHELFTASVRNAIGRMRFVPAEAGGRKVRQLIQEEFQFNVAVPLRADGTGDTTRTRATVLSPTRAPQASASDVEAARVRERAMDDRANRLMRAGDTTGATTALRAADRAREQGLVAEWQRTVAARDSAAARGALRPAMRNGAQPTRAPSRGERKAELLPDSPMPNYPSRLQSQGITGIVVAAFVVGPDGLVDAPTFKVIRSDHELFTQAVKNALPRLRFSPPEVDGRRVRQLIEMPFTFDLGG